MIVPMPWLLIAFHTKSFSISIGARQSVRSLIRLAFPGGFVEATLVRLHGVVEVRFIAVLRAPFLHD